MNCYSSYRGLHTTWPNETAPVRKCISTVLIIAVIRNIHTLHVRTFSTGWVSFDSLFVASTGSDTLFSEASK